MDGFELLTNEEYFKMADTIGLLDIKKDSPTKLTEKEAQDKINKWFAGLNRNQE